MCRSTARSGTVPLAQSPARGITIAPTNQHGASEYLSPGKAGGFMARKVALERLTQCAACRKAPGSAGGLPTAQRQRRGISKRPVTASVS